MPPAPLPTPSTLLLLPTCRTVAQSARLVARIPQERGPVPVVIGIHAERWAYCNGNCQRQRQYQLLWSDDRAYEWSVADGSGGNDEYLRSHNLSAVKEQWRPEHPRENVKWFCTGKLGKRGKNKWTQRRKSKVMDAPSWQFPPRT